MKGFTVSVLWRCSCCIRHRPSVALPVAPPARVDLGEVVRRDVAVEVVAATVVQLLRLLLGQGRAPRELVLRLLALVVVV